MIKSVEYALDAEGNKLSLMVTDEDDGVSFAPIGGVTAVNHAIDAFVAEGGSIGAGTIPVPA